MPGAMQAGELLADRYRLEDLLTESRGGRFWRATDTVLDRPVAVHVIARDDERSDGLVEAARLVGPLSDRRILRVLDAEVADDACYVVNEWGQGVSLDNLVQREGPQPPRKVAWLVSEVAEALAHAHHKGLAHGRLVPENVLIDDHGHVRIIGFGVDAALMGLPPGRRSADVTDLVSLLYFCLTGKWPGVSKSSMPPAPTDHGHVLRPRQVRAGIPRPLDALCDQVRNPVGLARSPRFEQDLTTAHGICEVLLEFLGDPTPAGNGVARGADSPAGNPATASTTDAATDAPADPPAASPTAAHPAAHAAADLPTQAGMPVFHDDSDDVEWLRARSEKPAPPPPLEEIPAKPLFAPDPPEGQPQRRPRPGARAAAADSGFWPWDSSNASQSPSGIHPAGHTGSWGTGSWGTGSWGTGSWAGEEALEDDGRVPGRSWIRLAMLVGLLALILVAAVAAYQLGLTDPDPEPVEPSTSASQSPASPQPFTDLTATDFDPQGDPPREENPELVPLVLDGDPSTAWRTSTYRQDFGPGGLKTGVGLVLDLGATKGVREIEVTTVGGDTAIAAYVTGTPPTGVADLTPVGTALGVDVLTVALDEAVSGRYVTVWLTSLPEVEDGFRGTIAEVQVRG